MNIFCVFLSPVKSCYWKQNVAYFVDSFEVASRLQYWSKNFWEISREGVV